MKKITQTQKMLLLTLCLLPSLGIAQNPIQNIFIIHNALGLPQSTVVIDVEMQNHLPIDAFQFDVPLPSGFTYIAGSAALNPVRHVNHIIEANTLPGTNTFRAIAFSLYGTAFIGSSGMLMSFMLNTPAQTGIYPLNLINCIMSYAYGCNVFTGAVNGTVTITQNLQLLQGDSNCNGSVNVVDVITTVKYMLGNNPQLFCFENADVNGDGIVNVIDVVGTVNMIMSRRGRY